MPPHRQSVREAAGRGREQRTGYLAQRDQLDEQVRENIPALDAILPSHMNAAQYTAIVSGLLARNEDLAVAAIVNPASFIAAMADCARLGLTPGDGYAFVPFGVKDGQPKPGKTPEVLGIVEYTGQVELIYRTQLVEAVVAEVVFEHDHYMPGRRVHEAPDFTRGPTEFATDAERGKPLGAFAYCLLKGGGNSRVVRMNADEILLHREVARTKDLWDGPFWRSAWLKTVTHELYKWVAKSSEYLIGANQAAAALAEQPAFRSLPRPNPTTIGSGNGGAVPMLSVRAIGSAEQQHDQPAQRRGRAGSRTPYGQIVDLFGTIGCTDSREQLRVVQAIVPDYPPGTDITDEQAAVIIPQLQSFIDDADTPEAGAPDDEFTGRTPYDVLRDWLDSPAGDDDTPDGS